MFEPSVAVTDPLALAAGETAEPDLVERARLGDADAFAVLVNARLGTALRSAKAILGNDDDAAEAVQDMFISAWKHLPSLRDANKLDAWLNRILTNRCRDALRRRGRSREIVLDVADLDGAGQATSGTAGSAIADAFGQLSVEQRHILLLHHVHGLPLVEIGRQLGIPVGTAKSRLWTARRALERALEGER